jgi:hypothetical protein
MERPRIVTKDGVCDCADATVTTRWPCGCGGTLDECGWHCEALAHEGAAHLDGKHWSWDCAVNELLRRLSSLKG